MVTLETIVVRNAATLGAEVDGETVLMSIENSQYYQLTATSRTIWERLKDPVRVRDLCMALADTYRTSLETVSVDTLAFLAYLEDRRMIECRIDQHAPDPALHS